MRERARAAHPGFRLLEPWLGMLGAWLARLQSPGLRAQLERGLLRSGDYLGLSADELLALALLQAVASAATGALLGTTLDWHPVALCVLAFGLGLAAPWMRVVQQARIRALHVERGLPEAIDLLSLCMSAGLDFGAGLSLLLEECSLRHAALQDELERVAHALRLGQTRRDALMDFAERVPTSAARDFANAVAQAERTGTPLRNVLEIQARVLRLRRSVTAELLAARAAVLLLGPLFLLLAAIMLVIFGPFVVNGIGM